MKPRSTRRLIPAPALGLALVAALLLSGLAAGSASASTQQWYSCKNVGASGAYTDAACQSQGKGNYDWSKLTSTGTNFSLAGSSNWTLAATIAGLKATITCTGSSAAGPIANSGPSGAGALSTASFSLTGCTAKWQTGCTEVNEFVGGGISFKSLKGEATVFGSSPAVKLSPAEGTSLGEFKIKCDKATITGNMTEFLYGVVNSKTSSLEVTEAGGASLKVNNAKATLLGTAGIETEAAEKLRLGLPPVSTAPPTISPAAPTVGTPLAASTGTWANEPSSYAYQWSLCNMAGSECQELAGQTTTTYTPGESDEGKTLKVKVTASNVSGSASASSAPSGVVNSTTTENHHWYQCKSVGAGNGRYADAACQSSEAGGSYDWVRVAEGVPLSVSTANRTPVKISATVFGITATIECSESGSSTVENPTGGGAGTLASSGSLLGLTGCKATAPSGCTMIGENVTGYGVLGTTTGSSLAITPTGSNLFSYSLNASKCNLVSEYKVGGTLRGTVNSVSSSLDFDSTGGHELKAGGASMWVEGSIQLKAEGKLLRFKP
jgi:hypothetical protein